MDILGGIMDLGNLFGGNTPEPVVTPDPVIAPDPITPAPVIAPNVETIHDSFTTNNMSERSGGSIIPMSRQGASGMVGNYMVETGEPDLNELDVTEQGNNNEGRGMAQYSHTRREPYLRALDAHVRNGGDPNDVNFQLQYAADEYAGKHDPDGRSLSGWTRSLSGETAGMSPKDSALHLRKEYFAPSEPHDARRIEAAQRVDSKIQQRNQRIEQLSSKAGLRNSSLAHVGHRGADGRYWAGDDWGWQSPESYKKLIGY